jgi:hypothetical protein
MKWHKSAIRLVWWSFGIAVALVGILWTLWRISSDWINDWVLFVYKPAFVGAAYVSGDPHDMNAVVWFLAQVFQTFLMIYLIAGGVLAAWYLLRRTHSHSMGSD